VADLEKEITQHGMTMADLNEQVGLKLRIESLMEAEKYDATVTEAEAKGFYEQNPQHFSQAEQVQASHILCGKRGITEAEFPAELEKIQAAQARLKAGEAFADVAKAVSSCPSSAQGGDLGFFGKGQMDPAFEKAAFETEVGTTTDIVKSSFGYHLILVTDKKAASTVPFEDAKSDITQYLTRQKKQEFWTAYNQSLKDKATIAYSPTEQRAREATEQAQQQQSLLPPQ
jgi:peptidyl-prolyl cis-trans isomerase C